jgi:hypothetical protein
MAIVGLLFLLSACTGTHHDASTGGGVSVGNGMKPGGYEQYASAKYDFKFQYSPKLTLTKISEERVELDNHNLITGPNLPMSTLVVEVVKPAKPMESKAQLLAYARGAHPTLNLRFSPLENLLPKADTVAADVFPPRISAGFHRIYYLLTTNHSLVRVSLNSPKSSPGWENIYEVVEKFNQELKGVTP